jgi:hypothetical protein
MTAISLPDRNDATAGASRAATSRWSAVARRKVYFGHQSVGADVISGVQTWTDDLGLGLRVVQSRDPAAVAGPALVHFMAGDNRDFASKNSAMLRFLGARAEADGAIALLKYCYVDVAHDTNVDALFEEYWNTAAAVALDHPDVTVVHTTIPLTTVRSGLRSGVKQLFGRDVSRRAAVSRHRYNTLLRAEFAGSEPIFDIARVEAVRADGTRAGFIDGGVWIETLAHENTYDGGHLNHGGKRAAAAELLDVLSDVIEGAA